MIPRLDARKIDTRDPETMAALKKGAEEVGFLTVNNTDLSRAEVEIAIAAYRAFFRLPIQDKSMVDMAKTGSNRGWGAPGSEQVDPDSNPDYKQYFDCGYQVPAGDPMADKFVYAPNQWPERLEVFRAAIEAYYTKSLTVAMKLLRGIAAAIDEDDTYFDDKFSQPMALLRGNYYPERPEWAGDKDFGIATHTDYGCLTLLATDGTPGLEVRKRGGGWIPVNAEPGEFVINFGEMIQMWTEKRVVATPHRVKSVPNERISIPLFFNPNYNANVAPRGSDQAISAGDHLAKRFEETYLHLQKKKD